MWVYLPIYLMFLLSSPSRFSLNDFTEIVLGPPRAAAEVEAKVDLRKLIY